MFICVIRRRVALPPICPCHLLPAALLNNPGLCKWMELVQEGRKTCREWHLLIVSICLHRSLFPALGAAAESCFAPAPGTTEDAVMPHCIGPWLCAGDTQLKMSPSSPKTPGLAPSWTSTVTANPVPRSWGYSRCAWGTLTAPGSPCPCGDNPDPCPGAAALSEGTGWGQAGVMAGVAHAAGRVVPKIGACTGIYVCVCLHPLVLPHPTRLTAAWGRVAPHRRDK